MAIVPEHIRFYEDIFGLPELVRGSVLTIGVQDLRFRGGRPPPESLGDWGHQIFWRWKLRGKAYAPYNGFRGFDDYLAARGASAVTTLDFFDERADIKHNLNEPIPETLKENFDLVIDVGNTEHVFDTRQCLESLFACVKVGGHLLLHLPVSGYFAHGLHVFNPQGLIDALTLNHFESRYRAYSTRRGRYLKRPHPTRDTLIWLAARKQDHTGPFRVPQQTLWSDYYASPRSQARFKTQRDYWKQAGA